MRTINAGNSGPDESEAGSLKIVIKPPSLSAQDGISAKDISEMERLMNQDVLEMEQFPEILEEAATISVSKMNDMHFSAMLKGNLTLHGATHSQPINVRVALLESILSASGDFSLNQIDYDIKLVLVAGAH
jgi:polyisoprenoid-binding protein YceI